MSLLLVVAFLLVPIAELYVLVQVGQRIGVLETIVVLLIVAAVGSWLVKREGLRAWRGFLQALHERRVPAREVADGALVIFGGALLLTPGFLTDVLGLLLILPPTRSALRGAVTARIARRLGVVDVRRLP